MDEFDLDEDLVNKMNSIYGVEPRSERREICSCGHAMSRHRFDSLNNVWVCKPGQLSCDCGLMKAVIEVPNTRYFMRKSMGSGEKHALPRGIAAARAAMGADFDERKKWLVDPVCDKCGVEAKFYPVRIADGVILQDSDDTPVTSVATLFLCIECRNPQTNN